MTKLDEAKAKKDVIYVDIDDDITSIIDKVKSASAPIVALVPPKRIGALQSVVNLKLLDRAANSAHKRVVLITSDHALTALAAGVAMPVARNLQSKPEIAEAPTDEGELDDDVIEGDDISPLPSDESPVSEADKDQASGEKAAPLPLSERGKSHRAASVPNFDAFRNKIVLIGGGILVLITFLVWAIVFAPRATVTITAKTTPYSVNTSLSARVGATLDAQKGVMPAIAKEIKKTVSLDFQATGKKDVGEKATGPVKLSNSSSVAVSVEAGTVLMSSSGAKFVTSEDVSVPAATLAFSCPGFLCPGSATSTVTANAPGSSYNAASGSLSGGPSNITVTLTSPTSGGTDKTVTVVSEQDAQAAKEKLQTQDANTVKADLKKQFTTDMIAVEESYTVTPGNPVVSPAVGEEASTAKLSVETVYTMVGFARNDIRSVVEKDLTKQLAGLPNQTIYDSGMGSIKFASFTQQDKTYTVNLSTTGSVGPSIDSAVLAKKLVGKREGEIIAEVKTYEGIRQVSVNFTPFWVSTAPAAEKITIKFLIENASR